MGLSDVERIIGRHHQVAPLPRGGQVLGVIGIVVVVADAMESDRIEILHLGDEIAERKVILIPVLVPRQIAHRQYIDRTLFGQDEAVDIVDKIAELFQVVVAARQVVVGGGDQYAAVVIDGPKREIELFDRKVVAMNRREICGMFITVSGIYPEGSEINTLPSDLSE